MTDGDVFLNEIRSELARIALMQETLSKDIERLLARLAGKWPHEQRQCSATNLYDVQCTLPEGHDSQHSGW